MDTLFEKLKDMPQSGASDNLSHEELLMLTKLDEKDEKELIFEEQYCLGTMILNACGLMEFFRVMNLLKYKVPPSTFKIIINYDCSMQDRCNPIDAGFYSGKTITDGLNIAFTIIEKYFNCKYDLIFSPRKYARFSSLVEYISEYTKEDGRRFIMNVLDTRNFAHVIVLRNMSKN